MRISISKSALATVVTILLLEASIQHSKAANTYDFFEFGFEATVVEPFPSILGIKPFISFYNCISFDYGGDIPTLLLSLISKYDSYIFGGSLRIRYPFSENSPFIGLTQSRQVVQQDDKLYGGSAVRDHISPTLGYEFRYGSHLRVGIGAQLIFKKNPDGAYMLLTDVNPQKSVSVYPWGFIGYGF